ncbi:MAG: GNAT family N-acetyltransferase [Methanobacterium sp.]|nr:GNAT family N-acetyltransferase [Methanobacterium sp.]
MSIKTKVKEHFTSNPLKGHLERIPIKSHRDFSPQNTVGNESSKDIQLGHGLNFRKFTLEDLDECAILFKEVFSAGPWYDEWVSLDQSRNYLGELVENPVFKGFVMCEGSKIVAVCLGHRRSWWRGKEFFLDELFVENSSQGRGIGSKTVNDLLKVLFEEKYNRVILLTNKGIPAEVFYLKKGFYNNEKRTVMVLEM